jgi:hypothetical protein
VASHQEAPKAERVSLCLGGRWSLRFITDFADDILTAVEEFLPLFAVSPSRRERNRAGWKRKRNNETLLKIRNLLERYRKAGRPLPRGPFGGNTALRPAVAGTPSLLIRAPKWPAFIGWPAHPCSRCQASVSSGWWRCSCCHGCRSIGAGDPRPGRGTGDGGSPRRSRTG